MALSVLLGGALGAGGHLLSELPPGQGTGVPDTPRNAAYLAAPPGSGQGVGTSVGGTVTSTATPGDGSTTATTEPTGPPSTTTGPPSSPGETTSEPAPSTETEPAPRPDSSSRKPTVLRDDSLTGQVVTLVNEARARAGCEPVRTDDRLAAAAQAHSEDMAARGYFSHTTPEGVTFDQRIRRAGYPKPGAENIAMGARSADKVMSMWMNSPGHRKNILNCSLDTIGVGLERSGWYWTQNFGY
nr:CAP domain-containing protein [Amycolatopsis aidingensis]